MLGIQNVGYGANSTASVGNSGQSNKSVTIKNVNVNFTPTGSPDADANTVKNNYAQVSGENIGLAEVKNYLKAQLGNPPKQGNQIDFQA